MLYLEWCMHCRQYCCVVIHLVTNVVTYSDDTCIVANVVILTLIHVLPPVLYFHCYMYCHHKCAYNDICISSSVVLAVILVLLPVKYLQ